MAESKPAAWVTVGLRWWSVLEITLALFWLALVIEAFSHPSIDFGGWLYAFFLAAPLTLSALLRLPTFLWLFRKRKRSQIIHSLIIWCITPTIGILGFVCAKTDIDFRLRFQASLPAMTAYVEDVASSTDQWRQNERAGLYLIKHAYVVEDAVLLVTTYPVPFDESGFVFAPNGLPDKLRNHPYETSPLTSEWRTFYFYE